MKWGFMPCPGHCQQCPEGLGRDSGTGAWGLWLSPLTSSTLSGWAQLKPTAPHGGTAGGLAQTGGRWPSGLPIKRTRTELATKINTASTQISKTCVTLWRQNSNYFKMIFTITLASSIEHRSWQLQLCVLRSHRRRWQSCSSAWAPLPSHAPAITHTRAMKMFIAQYWEER